MASGFSVSEACTQHLAAVLEVHYSAKVHHALELPAVELPACKKVSSSLSSGMEFSVPIWRKPVKTNGPGEMQRWNHSEASPLINVPGQICVMPARDSG